MTPEKLLPKRAVDYIHEMGVRALDHLADNVHPSPLTAGTSHAKPADSAVNSAVEHEAGTRQSADVTASSAVATLVGYWRSMTSDEKEEFVDRVAASVIEVVAASAALPVGLKLGKRAVKATRRVLKRETKKVRKLAKQARKAEKTEKQTAAPKKKAGTPKAAKRTRQRSAAKRPAPRRPTKKTTEKTGPA